MSIKIVLSERELYSGGVQLALIDLQLRRLQLYNDQVHLDAHHFKIPHLQ